MKNPRIWESSSRPLFIRSIWLDSSVGARRHFLLEDEPQRRINSLSLKLKRDDTLRTSIPYESSLQESKETSLELIGLSKAQYKPSKTLKRPTKMNKTMVTQRFYQDIFLRRNDIFRDDLPSKRSSLQDINSTLSNASNSDERLAERVLNWLDLAGKSPVTNQHTSGIENETLKPSEQSKKVKISKSKKTSQSAEEKRPDPIKHISITFNKEKMPIRYNRAQKFADNNNGNTSPSFKRFFSRGYENGVHGPMSATISSGNRTTEKSNYDSKARPKTTTQRKINHKCEFEKQLSKQVGNNGCGLNDSRKQLHIFMPSLPKKNFHTEDVSSLLSNGISEFCKF